MSMAKFLPFDLRCCQLCFEHFELVFRNQIQLFVQRKLSNTLAMGLGGDVEVDDFRFCVLSVTERTLVIVY